MSKVYVFLRNADSTEGRGPMLVDSVWGNEQKLREHLGLPETKPAIMMGKHRAWSNGMQEYREYDLILDSNHYDTLLQLDAREKALAKLTTEEKKILGLA